MLEEHKAIIKLWFFRICRTVHNGDGAQQFLTEVKAVLLVGSVSLGPVGNCRKVLVFLEGLDFPQEEPLGGFVPIPFGQVGWFDGLLLS